MEEIKQAKVWNLDFWVWKLTLFMNPMRLCMNFHALMVFLLPKSRVLLGFYLNPKVIASKVGKTPYGSRSS